MLSQNHYPPRLLALIGKRSAGHNIFLYLGDRVIVGRQSNIGLPLPDDEVSAQHCAVTYREQGLFVEDLGSCNGTYLARRRIHQAELIKAGQLIQLGVSTLKLFPPDPELPELPNTRLIRLLGIGGQARVYEAQVPQVPHRVALKVMYPDLTDKDRVRCHREASLQATLNHPNIARCFGFYEESGELVLVNELILGQSLEIHLKEKRPLLWEAAVDLGHVAAMAFAHAHRKGVLHRDIKPGNLIIEEESRQLKIIDFGLAKRSSNEANIGLTSMGAMIGTYGYMAKEAFFDGRDLDYAADIFSLGATLYQLISGREPFPALTIRQHLELRERPIEPITDSCPAELAYVLQKALNTQPQDRYPNMEAFAGALIEVLKRAL
jgi:eukaryotic-like serine/threonine-protein kinase